MNWKDPYWWIVAILVAGMVIGLHFYYKEVKACEKRGGIYLKTGRGMACIGAYK